MECECNTCKRRYKIITYDKFKPNSIICSFCGSNDMKFYWIDKNGDDN